MLSQHYETLSDPSVGFSQRCDRDSDPSAANILLICFYFNRILFYEIYD